MVPRQRAVLLSVSLTQVRSGEPSEEEPIEPAVAPFPVDACPSRVGDAEGSIRRPFAAPPVEPELRVGVVAEGEVVTEVVEVTSVRRAVAKQFVDAEARREHSAATSGA